MSLAEQAILQSILDGDRSFTGLGTAALRQEALDRGMRPSASVGRNPKGHDAEERHGRDDEHAVGEAETPNLKTRPTYSGGE